MTHSVIVQVLRSLMGQLGGVVWYSLSRVLEALADIAESFPDDPAMVIAARGLASILTEVEGSGTFKVIDYTDPHPDPIPESGAIEYRITGTVQGVGFRAYLQHEANTIGITGWIRNEPDGSVRAVVYPGWGYHADQIHAFSDAILNAPNAAIATIDTHVL